MELNINDKKIKIYLYDTFFLKLKGLALKKNKINYGICLKRCNSIHTFFMFQNIDICMTDKNNKIIYLKSNLGKNKIVLPKRNGYFTYELPLNTVSNLKLNDKIKIEE